MHTKTKKKETNDKRNYLYSHKIKHKIHTKQEDVKT